MGARWSGEERRSSPIGRRADDLNVRQRLAFANAWKRALVRVRSAGFNLRTQRDLDRAVDALFGALPDVDVDPSATSPTSETLRKTPTSTS